MLGSTLAAQPTLFLMVGLPGVGKTTTARQIEARAPALRLTPDEWMIPLCGESNGDGVRDVLEGRLIEIARDVLSLGRSVVPDFGVWTRDERTALRDLAEAVGAGCELVYLDLPVDEQNRRLEGRLEVAPETTFAIPQDDVGRYRDLFQSPDEDELDPSRATGPPPAGYGTWATWRTERWPSSP